MFDPKKIKQDFPIFQAYPNLAYLDNASTAQTPQAVLDAMNAYYAKYRSNIHRGVYTLSGQATEMYEAARQVAADFLNARFEEIVFTSGTTHGLNLFAYSLGKDLKPGDNVVLTRMEHHANLIPWQEMSKRYGFELRFIELTPASRLKTEDIRIDERTKVVSIVHVSNTLGTINPVEEIIRKAKNVGALTIVDAAQSVPHMEIEVRTMGCDALVFSGHKLYGPTGIGVLYAKRELLERLEPFFFGGDMIKEATYEKAVWNDVPWKFEGGTPNIAGAIGLAAAMQYVERIGFEHIEAHERELTIYALEQLRQVEGVTIIGETERPISPPHSPHRLGVISFTVAGIHPHDIATILDREYSVAVRAGHHCTMPLMKHLGIQGTVRASLSFYSTQEDIHKLVEGIKKAKEIFRA